MADRKNEIAEEMPEESLEELFAKLDQVAKELESGDTSLEESFGLYQKGMEMLKLCNEKIDTVEKKVQVLEENGEMEIRPLASNGNIQGKNNPINEFSWKKECKILTR